MQASRFRLYSKGLTRRRCLGCRTVVARWYTLCGQLPVARPARPSAPRLFGVSAPQFGVGAWQASGVVGSRVTQKLLEWSYPRNWGTFVWNEEGRSEYTLSPYLFPWLAA